MSKKVDSKERGEYFYKDKQRKYSKNSINYRMKIVFYLLILVDLTICVYDQFIFTTINCDFTLKTVQNNHQDFKLKQCQWTQCSKWKISPQKSICQNSYKKTSDIWQICMLKCCANAFLPQSLDSLNQCYYLNKPLSIWWKILMGLIPIIAIAIYFRRKKLQETRIPKEKWSSTCAICLNKSLNIGLGCQHNFHNDCMAEEMKHRDCCPMCKQKIFSVILYCKKCRNQITTFTNPKHIKKQLQLCKNCKKI